MEDLLGAYSTCANWLGNLAVDARFELARFDSDPERYGDFPALDRFLQSFAAARIKHPERMKNLDEALKKSTHRHDIMRFEGELFELMTNPEMRHPDLRHLSREKTIKLGRELGIMAAALFKIDKEFSKRLRTYIDTQGV